jgi:hypothetical protein
MKKFLEVQQTGHYVEVKFGQEGVNTMAIDIGNVVLMGSLILLIILFFVSFMMFIRRNLINQGIKANNTVNVEKKLDKIIELLEKEKSGT